jgi:class 3 adenylate cyclase
MSDRATRLHEAEATMRMLQHEVRTPLGHIIGYSEMLEEEMLERNIEDLGEDLAKIRRAATRLLDLVDGKLLTDPTEEIAQTRPADSTAKEALTSAVESTVEAPDATGVLRGKILVVDADVDARERLMRELRRRGLAVEAARDGIDALRGIAEGNFKLVVLDLLLPGMNGLEVLERIRRSRSMSELPVVLVAALTDPADAIEGLDRGGNDFVAKPFVVSLVAARIEAQLAAHRSARQVAALARQLEFRNAFIRQALGRSVPEDLLVELSERPDATKLGGEQREVIALVADIRKTRRWMADCTPDQVFSILNNVFGPLSAAVDRYGGTVNSIDGDSLTALFGLPVHESDDAERATACGIAMQLAMREVNARNRRVALPELEIGVGIATGNVLVGGIGSGKSLRYSVIGSPLIRATQIERAALPGEVLACKETCENAGETLTRIEPRSGPFEGLNADERLQSILGVGGQQLISLRAEPGR